MTIAPALAGLPSASIEEGGRVREKLRDGVQKLGSIEALTRAGAERPAEFAHLLMWELHGIVEQENRSVESFPAEKVPRGDISEPYKWKDRLAAVSPNSNHVF